MSGNTRGKKASGQTFAMSADSDSDISLTSTVDEGHDPDQEFEVEDVLAEEVFGDGIKRFLVSWSNFPLHECTWEPEVNLGSDLREQWEEKKARQQQGQEAAFDVQDYNDAHIKAHREKAERHRRRNARRKSLGWPLTAPFEGQGHDDSKSGSDTTSEADTSAEAMEDNSIDHDTRAALTGQGPSKKEIGSKPIPRRSQHPMARETAQKKAQGNKQSHASKPSPTRVTKSNPNKTSSTVSRRNEPLSATGYQGTARKTAASVAIPKANVSTAPAASRGASLAGKFSSSKTGLKAKKSVQRAKPVVGNVFVSGKTRKLKQSFGDAMVDPTKSQRLFGKHRTVRQAELRSREKADQAPDLAVLQAAGGLFDISKGPQKKQLSREITEGNGRAGPLPAQQEEQASPNELPDSRPQAEQQPDLAITSLPLSSNVPAPKTTRRPKKKAPKSVRFLDEGSLFGEDPMEIDSPSSVVQVEHEMNNVTGQNGQEPSAPASIYHRPPTPPPGERRKLSLGVQQTSVMRSVGKRVMVGGAESPTVQVTFNGVPHEPDLPWLSRFLDQDILMFGHTCFARNLVTQLNQCRQQNLCDGSITTADESSVLNDIAEHLRISLSGLYYSDPEYSIVVYPTKCEEWKTDVLGTEPSSPEGVVLRYVIFMPLTNLGPLLRAPGTPAGSFEIPQPGHDREVITRQFLGLEHDKLWPASSLASEGQHVFIAFPEAKTEFVKSLCLWLRAHNPESQIYIGQQPGAWSAFVQKTSSVKRRSAVVLIHESLVGTIRRFPGLWHVLHNPQQAYDFWCVSSFGQPDLLHLSAASSVLGSTPRSISISGLFPTGQAILVTPSFMVSEPVKTFDFFRWFLHYNKSNPRCRLVLAWDIRGFLESLAIEKSQRRKRFLQDQQYGIVEQALQANLRAITEEDCHAMWRASFMVPVNSDYPESRSGPYAAFEENGPFIYADSCIDANDEQSLVNWFGWWSMMRLDQCRKFYVLGSSKSIEPPTAKGLRVLNIPLYSSDSNNDPDAFFEKNGYDVSSSPATAAQGAAIARPDNDMAMHSMPPSSGSIRQDRQVDSFDGDENHANWASKLRDLNATRCPWKVYGFPVSWKDWEMADHFLDGGEHRGYRRLEEWFNWAYPWLQGEGNNFNTYIGFFYTIAGKWDPALYPRSQRPARHAWIGIYRPVNCYWKHQPYRRCEIIIWDASVKVRLQDKPHVTEDDLTDMQRFMIEHVRREGSIKNPGTYIDQVWLGGFEHPEEAQSQRPFDVTVTFLQQLMINIKHWLPAPQSVMPTRGYRKVAFGDPTQMSSPNRQAIEDTSRHHTRLSDDGDAMDLDTDEDDKPHDLDTKIIFHPPRGTLNRPGKPKVLSKCGNDLYETARLARLRETTTKTMEYTYKPTLQWYENQKAEGRAFEHVYVGEWTEVFKALGVDRPPSDLTASGRKEPLLTPADQRSTFEEDQLDD